MIQLILVRHAKSDWGDPSLADHDRPLNARGRANALMMAERLAATSASVDRILSSTAVRARTTADHFGEALGLSIELDPELYLASAPTMLAKAAAAGSPAVLIIAHDPGITDLAARLSDGGITHMPTCAVARFEWSTGEQRGADGWRGAQTQLPDTWSLETPRGT